MITVTLDKNGEESVRGRREVVDKMDVTGDEG